MSQKFPIITGQTWIFGTLRHNLMDQASRGCHACVGYQDNHTTKKANPISSLLGELKCIRASSIGSSKLIMGIYFKKGPPTASLYLDIFFAHKQ